MGGLLAIIRLSITVSNAECLIAELVRDKRVFASTEVTKAANSLTSCVPSLPTPKITKNGKNILHVYATDQGLARTRTGDLSQLILVNPKRES